MSAYKVNSSGSNKRWGGLKKDRIIEDTTCARTHTVTRDSALLTHQ